MPKYENIKIGFNSADSAQYAARAIIAIFPYVEKKLKLNPHHFLKPGGGGDEAKPEALTLRNHRPIIITNDIVNLSVNTSKEGLSHTLSATLVPGSYNYLPLCGPSDYIFAWIVNSDVMKKKIIDALESGKAANWFDSGLKFFGQIQTIQENFKVSSNGMKIIRYSLSAMGFQAYHSQIHYSPFLAINDDKVGAKQLFMGNLFKPTGDDALTAMVVNNWSVQEQLIFWHKMLLGAGPFTQRPAGGKEISYERTARGVFGIPAEVAATFGTKIHEDAAYTYADIIAFITGIEQFSKGGNGRLGPDSLIANKNGSFGTYFTPTEECYRLRGRRLINISPNMGCTVMSILQEHSNSTINEIYATLRPKPSGDSDIVPSFICRQIPFSTDRRQAFKTTNFFDLPRFEIDQSIISSYDISKSDALRYNTILITVQPLTAAGANVRTQAMNVLYGGWTYDPDDILRNGQRVFTATVMDTPFEDKSGSNAQMLLTGYNALVADFMENLHLKYSGSISLIGVQEPICVGENVQFGEIIGHIETVTHTYQVGADGLTSFVTSVSFVKGTHINKVLNETFVDNFHEDGTFSPLDGRSFGDIRPGQIKETTSQQEPLELKRKNTAVGGPDKTTKHNVGNKMPENK